jgi:hypothetical protein
MHRTTRRVALVAALLALLVAAVPATAHAADPNPPYVSSSQPGGYPLYGFHHDQLSPSVHAWAGLQRAPNGRYRLWLKVQGDGRAMSVEFKDVSFFDHGYATYGACQVSFCYKGPAATIYYTGTWHPVAEEASIKALWVRATYQGGASTPGECVASYRILRGQRYPIAGPTC